MRMLKQALQPFIDISVDWRVPSADVFQIPTRLPPVFSGSRLVVSGFPKLTSGNKGKRLNCKAILHYQQGTKKKSLSVHFTLPPPEKGLVCDSVDEYPVHRLASKQLLREVAKKNDKEELVRVSLETGVVCKETAFVAVAEDGGEAITSALERQTVSVSTRAGDLCYDAWAGPCSNDGDDCLVEIYHPADNYSKVRVTSYGCAAKCSELPIVYDEGSYEDYSAMSTSPKLSSTAGCPNDRSDFYGDPEYEECYAAFDMPSLPTFYSQSEGSYLTIICLQLFSGAWHLNEALAKICGRSLSDLQSSLPASLSSSSDKESVWATLLAVALLKHRHSSVDDEWELCVEKATLWLKGRLESTSQSVEALLAIATSLL